MPRITKLVIGCHSVLANGGLFGLSGSLSAVLAARAHSKPVVVVTGQYKFAPVWNMNFEHGSLDFQGGSAFAGGEAGNGGGGGEQELVSMCREGVEVESAYWEYVRPELVDLFVTNE
jgi:translation initiation factor eIF-2B subunit beta